jgi:hypothetical protein
MTPELAQDPVLWGECLSGALYWKDFIVMAKAAGFNDPRVVSSSAITLGNAEIEAKLKGYEFQSITYRLFKLPGMDKTGCEDYGHTATYNGSIKHCEAEFSLDAGHVFKPGKKEKVCRNTYMMLHDTRFAKHFTFGLLEGGEYHRGPFVECSTSAAASSSCCDTDSCCSSGGMPAPTTASGSSCCAAPSSAASSSSCCSTTPAKQSDEADFGALNMKEFPPTVCCACDGPSGSCDTPGAKPVPVVETKTKGCC